MKRSILISMIFLNILTSCSPHRQADNYARKNKITIMHPQAKFNKEESAKQLAKGFATIKGVLVHKNHVFAKYITLFPVTEYFESWYLLRKKKENKRNMILMSEEALTYRITTKIDKNGYFTFDNIKPGKYFLQAFKDENFQKNSKTQFNKRLPNYDAYNPKSENKRHFSPKYERIEKFIEVIKEAEIVKVNFK